MKNPRNLHEYLMNLSAEKEQFEELKKLVGEHKQKQWDSAVEVERMKLGAVQKKNPFQ